MLFCQKTDIGYKVLLGRLPWTERVFSSRTLICFVLSTSCFLLSFQMGLQQNMCYIILLLLFAHEIMHLGLKYPAYTF